MKPCMARFPRIEKGDLVGIRVTASNGGNGSTSTLYIYQWLP